jgi:hypothetical protein
MADYSPRYVSTSFIRNFTTPPLDYTDVSEAELLAKIEAVEYYVDTVFETGAAVPCALLVLSKLIQNPNLAKKYYTLASENFRGDYSYTLKDGGGSMSPYEISESWETMALKMLRMKSFTRDNKLKIYIVND